MMLVQGGMWGDGKKPYLAHDLVRGTNRIDWRAYECLQIKTTRSSLLRKSLNSSAANPVPFTT
jgi:hypothetical protein